MKKTNYKVVEKFDLNIVEENCINTDENGLVEILIPTPGMIWGFPIDLVSVLKELMTEEPIKKESTMKIELTNEFKWFKKRDLISSDAPFVYNNPADQGVSCDYFVLKQKVIDNGISKWVEIPMG